MKHLLGSRIQVFDFEKLGFIIECNPFDIFLRSTLDMRRKFYRLCEYDRFRWNADTERIENLSFRCTVEARAQCGQHLAHHRRVITFHRCEKSEKIVYLNPLRYAFTQAIPKKGKTRGKHSVHNLCFASTSDTSQINNGSSSNPSSIFRRMIFSKSNFSGSTVHLSNGKRTILRASIFKLRKTTIVSMQTGRELLDRYNLYNKCALQF